MSYESSHAGICPFCNTPRLYRSGSGWGCLHCGTWFRVNVVTRSWFRAFCVHMLGLFAFLVIFGTGGNLSKSTGNDKLAVMGLVAGIMGWVVIAKVCRRSTMITRTY